MTNQHPLTDEMLQELSEEPLDGLVGGNFVKEYMRAAADWQLEQVERSVKLKLKDWRESGYADANRLSGYTADTIESFFEDIMQAMRPQHPVREEDKPMTDHMRSVANKAITEARAMLESLVSDGSIDRQTYYDFIGEFEETMLPEENN